MSFISITIHIRNVSTLSLYFIFTVIYRAKYAVNCPVFYIIIYLRKYPQLIVEQTLLGDYSEP